MTVATPLRGLMLALAIVLALAASQACGPVRDALVAPHHAGPCDPAPPDAGAASLCRGDVPYVCSPRGHLWPATPSGAPCPFGCVEAPDGARCRARGEAAR